MKGLVSKETMVQRSHERLALDTLALRWCCGEGNLTLWTRRMRYHAYLVWKLVSSPERRHVEASPSLKIDQIATALRARNTHFQTAKLSPAHKRCMTYSSPTNGAHKFISVIFFLVFFLQNQSRIKGPFNVAKVNTFHKELHPNNHAVRYWDE